ncbi:MAG: 2-amino-4-hydroxy-6-hydroxymethyldihydropteridine diphosphokinase [Clostridia bacterium]|nr:2-amino-4-hydroxy-6-hydroxymethyldihydropteridine diphosphokinase [Clostridia bacterium]
MRAVLGLGGNLGDRAENLRAALDALAHLPGTAVTAVSSIYETAPVGYADQPDFYNLVAVVETELSPHALLGGCLGIEAALGRVRTFQNAPRVVDIDVLLIEGFTSDEEELTVPHPRMMERAFVLVPLKELFSDNIALGTSFPDVSDPSVRQI